MNHSHAFETSPSIGLLDNIGRLLVDMARHFQILALEKLHQRGHPRVRTSHTAVIGNLGLDTLRLTELAQRAGITQQAMGKLIKELERIGYVRRTLDETDRRARQIQLTERGIELMEDLAVVFADVRLEYAAAMGSIELDSMERQLRAAKRALGMDPAVDIEEAYLAPSGIAAVLSPAAAHTVNHGGMAPTRSFTHHQ